MEHEQYLAIPKLMTIDHRRQDGNWLAPPMRRDFDLVGPMVLPSSEVNAEASADLELSLSDLTLTLYGMAIGLSADQVAITVTSGSCA